MKTYHIGVDQAFRHAGYSVLSFDKESGKVAFEDSGVFNSTLKMGSASDALTFLEHLKFFKDLVAWVKSKGDLASIAIEGVAIGAVGQATARGGIFAVYSMNAVRSSDLVIVSPKKLKLYVTGNGGAEKEELASVLIPKYGLDKYMEDRYKDKNKEDKKRMFDEVDAIGLAEVGLYAWRVMHHGVRTVEKELSPEQQRILWSKDAVKGKVKSAEPKYFGICNRLNDFYLEKRP